MARVDASMRDGTKTELVARQFRWLGDEPASASGTDQGPTPYEQLLGALVSCTTITLRLYADHKGISLEGVDVVGTFSRTRNGSQAVEERIDMHVTLYGTFDDAQRKRLAQIAERCPVHRTLAGGVSFGHDITFVPSVS